VHRTPPVGSDAPAVRVIPGVGVTGAPNDDRGSRAGRFQLAVAVDKGGERVLVERDVVVELTDRASLSFASCSYTPESCSRRAVRDENEHRTGGDERREHASRDGSLPGEQRDDPRCREDPHGLEQEHHDEHCGGQVATETALAIGNHREGDEGAHRDD